MSHPLVNDWKIHNNIILYAFDYCLTRRSYAPSEFIQNVKNNKSLITSFMVNYMVKEIEKNIYRCEYGEGFDDIKEDWLNFKSFLLNLQITENK
jgi:hypothetical protein